MLTAEVFKTTRDLVHFVNDNHISKDNILKIFMKQEDRILLLYYTEDGRAE